LVQAVAATRSAHALQTIFRFFMCSYRC
jgi:hypothetical protein